MSDKYGLPNEDKTDILHEIDNDDGREKLVGGRKGRKFPVQWILDHGYIPYTPPVVSELEKIVFDAVIINDETYTRSVVPFTAEEIANAEAKHIREISDSIQSYMDETARSRGYDNIVNACGYAAAPNPFQTESLAFVSWRGEVWAYAYQVLDDVKAGGRTEPTVEELIAELPELSA